MEIIIDKIAIWTADYFKSGFQTRQMPIGMSYTTKTGIKSRSDKNIYRYAKDYTVGKTKFILFVRSFRNTNEIEKELDKVAKSLKEDFVKEKIAGASAINFNYLEEYIKGEK